MGIIIILGGGVAPKLLEVYMVERGFTNSVLRKMMILLHTFCHIAQIVCICSDTGFCHIYLNQQIREMVIMWWHCCRLTLAVKRAI